MVEEALTPRVQYCCKRDPRAEPALRHFEEGLGCGIEEGAERKGGGTTEERLEGCRDGEDGVEVRNRQKVPLLGFGPECLVETAAARAVPVTAGMERKPRVAALPALFHMGAKRSGAASNKVADDATLLTTEAE